MLSSDSLLLHKCLDSNRHLWYNPSYRHSKPFIGITEGDCLRTLFWDIETSLQPVAVFQLANNDWIRPESLLGERFIICAAWKWAGESKIHTVSVLDDPKRYKKDPHDDYHVVKTLRGVLAEADLIVHHKGDSFDKPWLNGQILMHGLAPLPPIPSVDTYKVAKTNFYLNSNSLDYLGKRLRVGAKISTGHGANLWMRVLNGERSAVEEMVRYNKGDVILLEKIFEKLRPYMSSHLNRELLGEEGCPRCGSKKLQSRGYHRAISRVYRRFQCQSCSGWKRRYTRLIALW